MEWILHWLVGRMPTGAESPFNIYYMVMWVFLVIIALDLIEAEKLEVECSLSVRRVLQYFALPFPHTFGFSAACLLPDAFFLILPLKFSPGHPHSLHLLAALRSCWFAVRAFWEFM